MTDAERDGLLRRAAEVEAATMAESLSGDVPSPCVSVCRMAADRSVCLGCLRRIDEIAGWRAMDDHDKRRIWRAIAGRALQAGPTPPTDGTPP